MSENSKETRERLVTQLDQLAVPNGSVLKIKRGDNQGPTIGAVYIWQEVARHAEAQLKASWKALESEGLIPDDDMLREGGVSEQRILTESNEFSVIAKVDPPRQVFSRDKFIAAVSKRFKLDAARLEAIARDCMTDTKPPLRKFVITAAA